MPVAIDFSDFMSALADLGRAERTDAEMQARVAVIVNDLHALETLSLATLTEFVIRHPDAVPVLATCAGLTQEQLKNQLSHRLQTSNWKLLARTRPTELLAVLEEQFDLVRRVSEQLNKEWTFADVLLERYLWSRRTATSAVGQGRTVEDEVEAVVKALQLPFQPRTRYAGRRSETAPCDLAIPAGGKSAQIVVAMKGFNSTGSKLSDAVREILEMADVRLPSQYVYVVIDGIGWKNGQADLRRIFELWENRTIDGLYTLAHLPQFQADLTAAALRLDLLPSATVEHPKDAS